MDVGGTRLTRRILWLASLQIGCNPQVGVEEGAGEASAGETGDATTTGPNTAPVAVDDIVYATQNDALLLDAASGLLGNDIDRDEDPLTVTDSDAVSARGGGVLVHDDGALTYEPPIGFWGTDSFGYTVADGDGEAATATVTVYVAPVLIPLADVVAGMGGFVVEEEANGDLHGYSVSGAGDVNGDGLLDLVVGGPVDPSGSDSGRSYVVFGKADTTGVQLSDIVGGVGGFALYG